MVVRKAQDPDDHGAIMASPQQLFRSAVREAARRGGATLRRAAERIQPTAEAFARKLRDEGIAPTVKMAGRTFDRVAVGMTKAQAKASAAATRAKGVSCRIVQRGRDFDVVVCRKSMRRR